MSLGAGMSSFKTLHGHEIHETHERLQGEKPTTESTDKCQPVMAMKPTNEA
jgi:hypothetical protein